MTCSRICFAIFFADNSRYLYDVDAFLLSELPVYEPEFSFRESTVLDRRRRAAQPMDAPEQTATPQRQQQQQQPEISPKSGINHGLNVTYSMEAGRGTGQVTSTTQQSGTAGSAGQINGKKATMPTPVVSITNSDNGNRSATSMDPSSTDKKLVRFSLQTRKKNP